MWDANSIDGTDIHGSCSWCEGSLQPHHYVQPVQWSVFVLCSEECLCAKLRYDAATRSTARRRNFERFVVTTSLIAACITGHDGPPSQRAALTLFKQPTADRAPLPGSFGPEWPPTEASLIA